MTPIQIRGAGAAAIILIFVAPYFLSSFSITLMNYIGVYALVAIGLALLTGVSGIVSFGQAAFVGVAAYATAWATAVSDYSPWIGLVLAIALTCSMAALLGLVTLKLQGHFLSLSTLAWGLAIAFLFGNIDGLGRFNGIANIPSIWLGSIEISPGAPIYYLTWVVVIVAVILAYNLLDSRSGRAMRTLRGGNLLTESLGINAFHIRLTVFVIAALLAAISGWLYAHMEHFVSPTPFEAKTGIEYLMMAMIGGAGSPIGAVIGAGILTLLKDYVQDILPAIVGGAAGQLEAVVFAFIFILFLQWARQGIVPFVTRWLPQPVKALPGPAPELARRDQPAPGTPLLEVREAEKRFGGLVAVNKVSFDIQAGEIVGLIGPNGAGKSTMFNLITGALKATSGEIRFAGHNLTGTSQRSIARGGIARTFQHVKLRPNMSVLDNVALGVYPRTRSGFLASALRLDRAEEASARYEAMKQLERVGLADKAHEQAGNLALGQQRVLEIARALAADPILLVLDEPAAGLRRQEKLALAELLKSLRAQHLTILIVEHDMDLVMNLVDRLVVMDFGTKISEGLPAEVRRDPRVQEAYLGGVH